MKELLNISKLAFRFNLDAATVRAKLNKAKIKPAQDKGNEKLYNLAEVDSILRNDALDDAKLRLARAGAEEKEIKVAGIKGELIAAADVRASLQAIFSNLHRAFKQSNTRMGGKLAKTKTAADATKLLQAESDKIFKRLRDTHQKFL